MRRSGIPFSSFLLLTGLPRCSGEGNNIQKKGKGGKRGGGGRVRIFALADHSSPVNSHHGHGAGGGRGKKERKRGGKRKKKKKRMSCCLRCGISSGHPLFPTTQTLVVVRGKKKKGVLKEKKKGGKKNRRGDESFLGKRGRIPVSLPRNFQFPLKRTTPRRKGKKVWEKKEGGGGRKRRHGHFDDPLPEFFVGSFGSLDIPEEKGKETSQE